MRKLFYSAWIAQSFKQVSKRSHIFVVAFRMLYLEIQATNPNSEAPFCFKHCLPSGGAGVVALAPISERMV